MYNLSTITAQPLTVQSFNGSELASKYIAYIDATPATVTTYARAIKQFILYLTNNGITEPTRADILAYKQSLAAAHKAATVQLYIVAVKAFFSWLEQEGLYPDIARHIKGAKVDKGFKRDALAASQAHDIIAGIDTDTQTGKRDYAIFALLSVCGLRTIEAERANIEDLRTTAAGTVLYVQGKGHAEKGELVKVPDEVAKAIRSYIATRPEAKAGDPLFTSTSNNSKGERMSTRSIRGLVKGYMKQAGYNSDRLTAHSLRHTGITLARQGGESLADTQAYARHSNINTTLIYDHSIDLSRNKCAETVYNAIFGNM